MFELIRAEGGVDARADAARETSARISALLSQLERTGVPHLDELHAALEQALALLGAVWPQLVEALGGAESQATLLVQLSQLAADAAQLLQTVVGIVAVPSAATKDGYVDGWGDSAAEANELTAPRRAAVAEVARLALGNAGAACCHHLSEQPDAGLNWLTAQQRVVKAVWPLVSRGRGDASAVLPPCVPLWLSLKGPAGFRSQSAAIREAAVCLLVDLLLLLRQTQQQQQQQQQLQRTHHESLGSTSAVAGTSSTGTSADVGVWAVVKELAGSVAPWDPDARVRAAALQGADKLLQLVRVAGAGVEPGAAGVGGEQAAAKEWRRVVQGVLTAAAKAAPEAVSAAPKDAAAALEAGSQIWEAALGIVRRHGCHPDWRAGVRHLTAQLLRAAAVEGDPEGPLAAYGIADVARALAGAAALEAALGPGTVGLLPDCAPGSRASSNVAASVDTRVADAPAKAEVGQLPVAQKLFTAAAVCITDAVGQYGPGSYRYPGAGAEALVQEWQQRWYLALLPGNGSGEGQPAAPAAVPRGGQPGGDAHSEAEAEAQAEAEAAAQEAEAVARSTRLMCASLGQALRAGDAMSLLEALVSDAESAPLAPKLPSSSPPPPHGSDTVALVSSRGAVLVAAAAAASGAAKGLRAACDCTDLSAEALAAAVRLTRLIRRLAALLQDPDQHLFAEAGGAPVTPTGPNAALARQSELAAAAGLAALAALREALPVPLVYSVASSSGAADTEDAGSRPAEARGSGTAATGFGGQPGQSTMRRREEPEDVGRGKAPFGVGRWTMQVFIEEIMEPESPLAAATPSPYQQAQEAWRDGQAPLLRDLLLLVATYAPCEAAGAAAGSSNAPDPALPVPPVEVDTPWAHPGGPAAAAASQLFAVLSRSTRVLPSPARALRAASSSGAGGRSSASGTGTATASGGSLGLLADEEVAAQELVLGCGAALMRDVIRPVVVQKHVQALEEGPIKPYSGPDTFARALAARRLAWLLMRCRHPFCSEVLRLALPLLLAACDDPSPAVAAYGVAALHAVAVECLAADLQWQRDLLLDAARRLVTGCSEQLWPLACPAAVALTQRIEGKDPRAPGYHALACTLLAEAERGAHVAARRLAFLPAAASLVACLGLTTCRYLSRLMPLLLEWLHAHDVVTRVQALGALGAVVRATWPRIPAHAAALWRHLLLVLVWAYGQAEGAVAIGGEEDAAGREEVRRRAEEVCGLVLACAREEVLSFVPASGTVPLAPSVENLHRRMVAGHS
ncbi:hypothetical protein HYH02_013608 [Chlamydomonas schloesseri]|uniref:Uncharacterized protein n=1 Tax=Chlamydomonas schloesseri TaxID=2026947 RepID=A0A835VYY1_9CHLO|nr:hypothetical protein HYH02_013608 [Chlamydomonas schloesseri]|eukprot:KAG2430769.1 hypothetical protein HYH02_013608 [Chlamydomonas schloesseri]